MQVNLEEAIRIAKRAFPNGKFKKVIDADSIFIFMIFSDRVDEEEYDPFYSVNKETGEFRDYSIMDADTSIFDKFEKDYVKLDKES